MPKSHDRPKSKLTQYFKPVTEESPQVTSEESTMVNMVFPKSIQAFSLDTGDEIGVTLFRQPPLPPSHPPGTYPPEQMRRWWFGEWADQLGDGRPVMLEEYLNRNAYPDEVKPR
ncbi:uncharacterized protein [Montipora foliosa]|uniref:uncharacterized protein isoform X1 n=1 Tax=Montipora foliosa TaxID=591990 RepID=UPI0035F0FD92